MRKQPAPTPALFRLKLRFQLMFLWLPILMGLTLMTAGGYWAGLGLAAHFGIDPEASLLAQPRGGQFCWMLMTLLAMLFAAGMAATYALIALALRLKLRDPKKVREILKGSTYPADWYSQ